MSAQKKHDDFGRKIVEKLRDENYDNYLNQADSARKISLKEYHDLPKNEEYDPNLKKIEDERFEFINGLSDKQKEQLDKLILQTLDATAFNFLREIEEGLHDNKSIGLTFQGSSIAEIYNEFLSGTFFGEYFLWLEKFSKHGEFQH